MNWPDLIDDVRIETGLLDQLLEEAADMIAAVGSGKTEPTTCLATGGVLQSFYNGVEKVFKLVAEALGETAPAGDNPRVALLDSMAKPSGARPSVIDANLAEQMTRYMMFREAYRYAHFFQLSWEQTAPLVADLHQTLDVFKTQLDYFFKAAGDVNSALAARPQTMPRYWTHPAESKPTGVSSQKTGIVMMVMTLAGLALGAAIMKYVIIEKPEPVPASVVTRFLDNARFTKPDGTVHKLPAGDKLKAFRVIDGSVTSGQDDPFSGCVAQPPAGPGRVSPLTVSFNQGRIISAEAINSQGQIERAIFSDKRIVRYTICRPDGLPMKTYHIAENGHAYCSIQWGIRPGPTLVRVRPEETEGWNYRFHSGGAGPWATVFVGRSGGTFSMMPPEELLDLIMRGRKAKEEANEDN